MEIVWILENINTNSFIDILLVAILLYCSSYLLRRSHAAALVRGTFLALASLLIILFVVANLFNLPALSWLSENLLAIVGVAILIVFQPELRRTLELLGSSNWVKRRQEAQKNQTRQLDELSRAASTLSERRHGALIVLQRNSNLSAYSRSGIPLDSELSAEILTSIFFPGSDLHDGAVIIDSGGRIAAAAVVLPLSASRNLPDRTLGTRHRAALGISEVSDSYCLIVSEETGRLSLARNGQIDLHLGASALREILLRDLPNLRFENTNVLNWLIHFGSNRKLEKHNQ